MLAPLQRQQRVSSLYSAPGGPLSPQPAQKHCFLGSHGIPLQYTLGMFDPFTVPPAAPGAPGQISGHARIPSPESLPLLLSEKQVQEGPATPWMRFPSSWSPQVKGAPLKLPPLPQHQRPAPQSRNQERPVASRDPPTLSQ